MRIGEIPIDQDEEPPKSKSKDSSIDEKLKKEVPTPLPEPASVVDVKNVDTPPR